MFYEEQQYRCGTLSQSISLGPARSSFERLFYGDDVSVSVMRIDCAVLDQTLEPALADSVRCDDR